MTLLEFAGSALIAFGPSLAMFCLSVANDSVKIILFIMSTFFWLLSFLTTAICWAFISRFCNCLLPIAYISVLSQEVYRYLFQVATQKVQTMISEIVIETEEHQQPRNPNERSTNVSINNSTSDIRTRTHLASTTAFEENRKQFSFVTGLGFGVMNTLCLFSNILADSAGPGSTGLKGDSQYFLLVSALTCVAFVFLNVAWSVLMSESLHKNDKKLIMIILATHLISTTATFANRAGLQVLSLIVLYTLTGVCGFGAFQLTGYHPKMLMAAMKRRD